MISFLLSSNLSEMFSSTIRASLIALALSVASASAAPGLSVKVSTAESFVGVDSLEVTTTITNTGSETLTLANDPNGVLSTFPADTFAITDGAGNAPEFTGAKVKWSPTYAASVGDVTTLAPGQSIDVTHDLKHNYNFTGTGEGAYTFEPRNIPFYIVGENNKVTTIHAEAEASAAKLVGRLVYPREVESLAKRATFRSCSSTRQSQIITAYGSAQSYASSALSYLNSHSTAGTTRYTTWFGTWTSSRFSTVQSHFSKISSNTLSSYTYDCTCTDSSYAYVYPGTFGVVYFCNAFWSAPNTGTDSKAGTIIHESSHFTANGGTNDYAYGQSAAKSLATSNPANAVFNADSHEYFAENNPALS